MKILINKRTKASYALLLKWFILSLLAGICGTVIVYTFISLLKLITAFFSTLIFPPPLIATLGALITGGVIYRIQPKSAGEGIPSYLHSLRFKGGYLNPSETFFKYWSGLATLSTYGNGGIVGPLGRVSAGTISLLVQKLRRIKYSRRDIRIGAICGMAACIGAIFHTPIGGGIFAVEIIQREKMEYKDIFPAVLSSCIAFFLCKTLHLKSFYQFSSTDQFMEVHMIGWLFAISIVAGVTGGLYTRLYAAIAKALRREGGSILIKVVVGSLIASAIAWFLNPALLGTSSAMLQAIVDGDMSTITGGVASYIPVGFTMILMMISKALCNCITVGSGMSAGFMGPAAIMGMLIGSTFAAFIHIVPGSPTDYAFIAAGFSGILASSMNIPLAAAVITIEIFGLYTSLPAGLAAIIGFQITRHRTIYDYAVAHPGLHTETNE